MTYKHELKLGWYIALLYSIYTKRTINDCDINWNER